jgi:GT2 family glycosyltransferase
VTPIFSIVIPTYQQTAELSLCLASLTELDYPPERFEVIVVNDGGPSIEKAVAPFLARLRLTTVRQENSGPAAARNTGVAHAQGKYLAFTDTDCRPDRAWLAQLERHLAADESALAGGKIVNSLEGNACSTASQLLVTYLYAYYNPNPEQARFFTSNNMAVARRTFLDIGGFSAEYHRAAGEDRELCDRWTHSGRRLLYAETALIRHAHRLTLGSFWRQHFVYGRGALHYRMSRARRDAGPLRVEPLRFYTGLLRYPWVGKVRRPMRIAALLLLAQIANVAGFFSEKLRGTDLGPQTPVIQRPEQHRRRVP